MKFLTSLLVLLIATLPSLAQNPPQSINGFWKNDQHQVVIELVITDYGFKTIRTDQDRWYRYEWSYDRVYTDQEGNRYIVHDQYSMMWESYDGRRLHFRKLQGEEWRDPVAPSADIRALAGQWIDFRLDVQVRIVPERGGFRARIWHGDWRFYDLVDRDYFEDRFGNSFTLLSNGRLMYRDQYSRREYVLQKVSPRF